MNDKKTEKNEELSEVCEDFEGDVEFGGNVELLNEEDL